MTLPGPFQTVVDLDAKLREPIVQIEDIKARRTARRMAQVYFLGPKGTDTSPGGTPVAVAA